MKPECPMQEFKWRLSSAASVPADRQMVQHTELPPGCPWSSIKTVKQPEWNGICYIQCIALWNTPAMHSICQSSLLSISGYQDKILQHLAERLVKRSHLIAALGNPNIFFSYPSVLKIESLFKTQRHSQNQNHRTGDGGRQVSSFLKSRHSGRPLSLPS